MKSIDICDVALLPFGYIITFAPSPKGRAMPRLDWYIRANLKLRHLQLLVALDDLRHVSRVAAHLNVTQPAVSKTLAALETGMATQLF
jgi:Bacterial regulatory helix-turn-helix protein, lysR family